MAFEAWMFETGNRFSNPKRGVIERKRYVKAKPRTGEARHFWVWTPPDGAAQVFPLLCDALRAAKGYGKP